MSDAGFSDAKVCLHKLKEEKYLSSKDNGRYTYTKKYSINGMEVDCVAMYCKDSQYEADITFENN